MAVITQAITENSVMVLVTISCCANYLNLSLQRGRIAFGPY